MHIKLWGTRGSLPRALTHQELKHTLQRLLSRARTRGIEDIAALQALLADDSDAPLTYGGNTTCTEIRYREESYVVDLGTGLVSFGKAQRNAGNRKFTFLLSHLHWDHILGLPFFPQIYERGCEIDIYHVHEHAPEHLRIKFNGVNFPVRWEELGASITFHRLELRRPYKFDDLTVTPFQLDHPGGSYGYRFDSPTAAVGIAVDNELKRRTAEELGEDRPLYQALDALLFDSQYDLNEMAKKYDWGHSSPPLGIDLAFQEMIKTLVMVHHSPAADDQSLRDKFNRARQYAAKIYPQHRQRWERVQVGGPRLISGYDGLEFNISRAS